MQIGRRKDFARLCEIGETSVRCIEHYRAVDEGARTISKESVDDMVVRGQDRDDASPCLRGSDVPLQTDSRGNLRYVFDYLDRRLGSGLRSVCHSATVSTVVEQV